MIGTVTGIVNKGKGEGKELGFPTANIAAPESLKSGVYAGVVRIQGKAILAAIFIPPRGGLLEAHLLDFAGDLYGSEITVEIRSKIRDSVPYTSSSDMRRRIAEDIENVRSLIR